MRNDLGVGAALLGLALGFGCNDPWLHRIDSRKAPTDSLGCAPTAVVQDLTLGIEAEGVRLSWLLVGIDAEGAQVLRRRYPQESYGELARVGVLEQSFLDTDLQPGNKYDYQVVSYRTVNGELCAATATTTVTHVTTPSALVALSIVPIHPATLELTVTDPNFYLTYRRIERAPLAGEYAWLDDAPLATNPYVDASAELLPDADYSYRVTPVNEAGEGPAIIAAGHTSFAPQLTWTAAPDISSTCELVVPGQVQLDTQSGVEFDSASGAVAACASVTASTQGLRCVLTEPTAGTYAASWTVNDRRGATAHGSSTLDRELEITIASTTRGPRRMPSLAVGRAYAPGVQAMQPECGSCEGARGHISVGGLASCALGESGEVRCWGNNEDSGSPSVGNGLGLSVLNPLPVCDGGGAFFCSAALTDVVQIAANAVHTCALRADGTPVCWGSNDHAQLANGHGTAASFYTPSPVCVDATCTASLTGVERLALGSEHTCALSSGTGNVSCWGLNNYGQVGSANAADNTVPIPTPVCVADGVGGCVPLSGATQLASRADHTCAIVAGGEVRCWGSAWSSQLGDGMNDTQLSPTKVCVSGSYDVTVDDCLDGGLPSTFSGAVVVDTAYYNTCAILAGTGEVRCWGDNTSGQLGNGDATHTLSPYPVGVCRSGTWNSAAIPPGCEGTDAAPLANAVGLAMSEYSNCAWLENGEVWCWGDNSYQDLADGTTTQRDNPVAVCLTGAWDDASKDCLDNAVSSKLTGVTTLTAGLASWGGNRCAVRTGGDLWCWGNNSDGQLGLGAIEGWQNPTPSRACLTGAGPTCVPWSGVDTVSAGGSHACALVDGAAYCWGAGYYGRLGVGFTDYQPYAMPVCERGAGVSCEPLGTAVSVASGLEHSCALIEGGQVACWGWGAYGQLGTGTDVDVRNASRVCASGSGATCVPLAGAVEVAAGLFHTCALLESGEVRCWGANECGQSGDGTAPLCDYYDGSNPAHRALNPVTVCAEGSGATCVPLTGVVGLAAGTDTTCALMTDGGLRCWGYGNDAKLGNGSEGGLMPPVFAPNPTRVCAPDSSDSPCAPLTDAVAVAVGDSHACAVLASGAVVCWGSGQYGGLGTGVAIDLAAVPRAVCEAGHSGVCVPLTGALSVAAGVGVSCALMGDGTVRCWGDGYMGAVGNGMYLESNTSAVPVCAKEAARDCYSLEPCGASLQDVIALSGAGSVMCALHSDHSLDCWGSNKDALLAIGEVGGDACVPTEVCVSGQGPGCQRGAPVADLARLQCQAAIARGL